MDNKDLKKKYDEMHKVGSSSGFSQGKEERELILKMGEPWERFDVLEIGCGEGDLLNEMNEVCASVAGVDFSKVAIEKAKKKYPHLFLVEGGYQDMVVYRRKFDRIVMQGVLEHLCDPFIELKWMIDNLLKKNGDVITSSPCFLNPRGIVWMTLDMLGAVMSKTDLHFLNPWEFRAFCYGNRYKLAWETCDWEWAKGDDMIADLKKRIPLALKDGNISYSQKRLDKLIEWLNSKMFPTYYGATAVYRISTEKGASHTIYKIKISTGNKKGAEAPDEIILNARR
jgi:SAM-dependent methyltransferase